MLGPGKWLIWERVGGEWCQDVMVSLRLFFDSLEAFLLSSCGILGNPLCFASMKVLLIPGFTASWRYRGLKFSNLDEDFDISLYIRLSPGGTGRQESCLAELLKAAS